MNQSPITKSPRPFHILTKPIGPICNLDCKYCFYLEKEALYPGENQWRMSDAVLEEYVRQYIRSQPVDQAIPALLEALPNDLRGILGPQLNLILELRGQKHDEH